MDNANEELEGMHAQEFIQARRDGLTGLGNRLRLREDLEALSKRSDRRDQTYSVAMCDVDHFKAYNDHYGHPAGDAVLRTVAATLTSHARQGDRLYRYGGEEFLLILPDQDIEAAAAAGERLRQAVERLAIPHAARISPRVITISIGVASIGLDDTESVGRLLKTADAALYQAKRAGRNRVAIAGARNRVLHLVPTDEIDARESG